MQVCYPALPVSLYFSLVQGSNGVLLQIEILLDRHCYWVRCCFLTCFFASLGNVKMTEQDDDCQNLVVAEFVV